MSETFIHPSAEQMAAIRQLDVDGPVVMLNMLRFAPDNGAAEYARYVQAATPFLQACGAEVRYIGNVATTFIGNDEWDQILLAEYPSKQAFLEMIGNPEYPADIRAGALVDSRLYCTQAVPA